MILFTDTETTGFPDWKLPLDHKDQPHLVQLAAQLCDKENRTLAEFCVVIDNGVDIPERASAVHGITRERAAEIGVPLGIALELYAHLHGMASLIVAHNMNFDRKIVDIAMARRAGIPALAAKPTFCTMVAATKIVNIPPTAKMVAAGLFKPKAPKLEECIRHFFGEEMIGAHDAMFDTTACRRVYFHLLSVNH